jgi:mono/diheme cytochrome c family protein
MRRVRWALVSAGFMIAAGSVGAIGADENETPQEPPPEFTKAYLDDPKNQAAGEVVWHEQCRHCHGSSAYPGKAPKLKPYRYKPEFVFDRVTYGFEKMPSWIDAYSREERMAVVAYILSDDFSP